MANYKTVEQLPLVEEVTETTNVLVEENGSLKRIPSSEVGGGGKVMFIIPNGDLFSGSTFTEMTADFEPVQEVTNDMVQQALKNGIVYVVNGTPEDYMKTQITMTMNTDGNCGYGAYFFFGCGAGFEMFSIVDP